MQVQGNYIGLDISGSAVLSNNGPGVQIEACRNITIGGAEAGQGNVISGNGSDAIGCFSDTRACNILGNFIGTDAAGTTALGNSNWGITLRAQGCTVGGPGTARNIISGNHAGGICVGEGYATGNRIENNYIGTDVTGTVSLSNSLVAMELGEVCSGNLVVGNVIAGRGGINVNAYEDSAFRTFEWPTAQGGNGHFYIVAPPPAAGPRPKPAPSPSAAIW